MNAIVLLMVLLVLAGLGSVLVGKGGVGLPSGIEYLVLGFLVGPQALAIVDRSMIDQFEPVLQVALGWFTLIVGLDIGFTGRERTMKRVMALGTASSLLTGAIVALAAYYALSQLRLLSVTERVLLSGGLGAACAETTRHAVRWVAGRTNASGPVTDLFSGFGSSDDLAPLAASAMLFALRPSQSALHLPPLGWFGVTIGLGLLLGGVGALLIRNTEGYEVWGALLGTALFGAGIATRFGLSTMAVTFAMGVVLGFSPHRRALRNLVRPTERSVLLPALLLAGARIDVGPLLQQKLLFLVIGAAIIGRVLGRVGAGWLFRMLTPKAANVSPWVGFALTSSGALSVGVALSFALRFPGVVGDTVLLGGVASALVGELIGPAVLRRTLDRAGEIPEAQDFAEKSAGSVPAPLGSAPPSPLSDPPPEATGQFEVRS